MLIVCSGIIGGGDHRRKGLVGRRRTGTICSSRQKKDEQIIRKGHKVQKLMPEYVLDEEYAFLKLHKI